MPQAVCTSCSSQLELPTQVSLDRVRCPRCQGTLKPAAPKPPAPPQKSPAPSPIRSGPPAATKAAVAPAKATPGWFYRDEDDLVQGPLSQAEFAKQLRSGDIPSDAMVRKGSAGPWMKASQLKIAGKPGSTASDDLDEEETEAAGMSQGMKFALVLVPLLALAIGLIFIAIKNKSSEPSNQPGPDQVAGGGLPQPGDKDKNPGGGVIVPPDKGGFIPAPGDRQQQVQFLGAQGQGRRFAIIADRSGSMNSMVRFAKPDMHGKTSMKSIDYLHEELVRTIKEIKPGCQFYISFFDSTIIPMPGADNWVEGGGPTGELEAWIRGVGPRGGTNPLPGFQKVLALDPPPDVIFFMTDGGFKDIRAIVADLNNRLPKKAVIHSIQFNPAAAAGVGAGARQTRIVKGFELPPDVARMFELAATPFGVPKPGGPKGGVVKGGFSPHMQLEEIALASGGTFRVYNAGDPKGEDGKGGARRLPVFTSAGEITAFDPICMHRANCHCKTFDVVMQAGLEYQVDVVGAVDPYVLVGDDTGRIFAQDDNSGGFRNAAIIFRPGVTGAYRITVTTSPPRQTGAYAMTVIQSPL